MITDQWVDLVNGRDNDPALLAESAPARNPPQWKKYWTNAFTLIGAFKTLVERAKIPYDGAMEGAARARICSHSCRGNLVPFTCCRTKCQPFLTLTPEKMAGGWPLQLRRQRLRHLQHVTVGQG